jgi:hypothetical protein
MFKAMCQEENDEKPNAKKEAVFDNYGQAFLLSIAIGISHDQKLPVGDDRHWLVRAEYIAGYYEPYRQLLKSMFPHSTDEQIVQMMVEFSEAGVRSLFEEFRKTGTIDFARLSTD